MTFLYCVVPLLVYIHKRRVLYPIRAISKNAGDDVYLSVDKLYINNSLYVPGEPVQSSKCYLLRDTHDPEAIRMHRIERAQKYADSRKTEQNRDRDSADASA